jgi:hypothetical protein
LSECPEWAIAERPGTRWSLGRLRVMVDSLPGMSAGEERDQIRFRLAAEIRRIIVGAEALGTEILIQLDGAIDLVIEKSRLVEFQIMDQETEDFFVFTWAQLFETLGFDPIGQFEAFINRNREAA